MKLDELIDLCVNGNLYRIVLSKPVKQSEVSKIVVRPILIKERLQYQITKSVGNKESNTCKEIHENVNKDELKKKLSEAIPDSFLQGLFETEDAGFSVLANKKGTVTIVKNKSVSGNKASLEHNRKKQYLIEEGKPVRFLVDLGVMTPDGKVAKAKYDKFRQINRYLEFVNDCVDKLEKKGPVTIIDFGCGKSYLTFALYYFLVELKKIDANIIGLDLKTDVIRECNRLKDKYGYRKLRFIEGDIEHFEGVDKVDMVMTLHACDTATDYAIYKAIKWDADIIMAVPCCQHELNRKTPTSELKGVTQYGILKERMAAIFTDAMRANLLTENGYDTQILEFIDMEHTPKNLLIRAVKRAGKMALQSNEKKEEELVRLSGGQITLEKLLKNEE